MGFFSWMASDTGRSIPSTYSSRRPFTVHMITEDGQVFTEDQYEGYGVFGGKDIYSFIAEMNGFKGKDDDDTRKLCFKHIWKRGIRKGDKILYHSWDREEGTFMRYDDPIPTENNICANNLVSEHGWLSFGDSGEFSEWAEQGFKMPKLVEILPAKYNWKAEWDKLPYPESCPDQGFFYGDNELNEW